MSNKSANSQIPPSPRGFKLRQIFQGHKNQIYSLAWSPDGRLLASGSRDKTIRIWNLETGKLRRKLEGHSLSVSCVAWSPDGSLVASGSFDGTIRIWNTKTKVVNRKIEGLSRTVNSVVWSPDGRKLASVSGKLLFWDTQSWELLKPRFNSSLNSMVCSPDARMFASEFGCSISLWDHSEGELRQRRLPGHSKPINSMAWSPDGEIFASASDDTTIKIWNCKTGICTAVLEGHRARVTGVSFSFDGRLLASKTGYGNIRLWRCDTWETVAVLNEQKHYLQYWRPGLAFHPKLPILATLGERDRVIHIWDLDLDVLLNSSPTLESVRYCNAKVVLVGDTGVGKSGLGMVLAGEKFKPTTSTHGRQVWRLGVTQHKKPEGIEELRETLLWDLAGQAEYRLIHQLSLDQTSMALVVFDSSRDSDPFKGVRFWNKALQQAKGNEYLVKYLVAARTDVSPVSVSEEKLRAFASLLGFQGVFLTSAATCKGVKELLQEIENAIDWEKLPLTVSESLFKQMKDFIVEVKQSGQHLTTATNLIQQFRNIYPEANFKDEEFSAALERVEAHDLIKVLSFGDYVLLRSELLDNYASAMARAARENDGLGFLDEQKAREGKFDFGSLQRVQPEEESIILQSVVELFIEKQLAISERGKLIFPSQFNRELPEHSETEGTTVYYEFEGALLNAYVTLVVRVYHSDAFNLEALGKNGALFLPFGRKDKAYRCGFILEELVEGTGRLKVFFGQKVVEETKVLFLKYIYEHLTRKALNASVKRERIYRCPKCQEEVVDRKAVKVRLEKGFPNIRCNYCDYAIELSDLIEETFGKDDKFLAKVRQMDKEIEQRIDNENKEGIHRGKVMVIVNEAGQICEFYSDKRYGIDGEIEFKDNNSKPSGQRIYMQLKYGDSYLRLGQDKTLSFRIQKEEHINYWQGQSYPVYLCVCNSSGKMYWKNVTEYLKNQPNQHKRTVVFCDEDEMTVEAIKAVRRVRLNHT